MEKAALTASHPPLPRPPPRPHARFQANSDAFALAVTYITFCYLFSNVLYIVAEIASVEAE
jgi:hypothetical protein